MTCVRVSVLLLSPLTGGKGMQENNRQPSGQTDKRRDISSKTVLGNPILCAQFLRDNVNIPCFKSVQPEDIEDVSERYRPYLGTEFESDTVKRIRIHDENKEDNSLREPLFLISLTEHKSRVDYDVAMQLLKYMLCIWIEYGKEMEAQKAGISDRKGFRYPTVIPVVYYEGKAPWTADCQFRARIARADMFPKWIPDFTYEVVRLHDYSNEELLERGNEMSLIMLFNKIQSVMDISEFLKLPQEKLDNMIKETPEAVMDIIVSVMESLCVKIGATETETQKCVDKVRERRMGYLFENIEKMDIQAERRNTAEARAEAKKAQEELKEAREEKVKIIVKFCKKLANSKEKAIQEVMEECRMDFETAQLKVDRYWDVQK